ncbi:cytochrome c oxidase assembly protein [Streptosporangium sp. NPDC051023]|uniref:cytochrome c oxidase assembly protein n=1 Tax=Streptosporangium sp. NPDC051023 TaxID=3155410 RepID=UPI0034505BBC
MAGLPDEGPFTRWGLPLAKLAMDGAAVLTVGALLMAVVLLPNSDGKLGAAARRWVGVASGAAFCWALAAAATLLFRVSTALGTPVTEMFGGGPAELAGLVVGSPWGVGLAVVVALTAVAGLLARRTVTAGGGALLLTLALTALLPPALTGHAASSPDHDLASTAVALHLMALSVWVGGLAVLCWHTLGGWPEPATAAERFSRAALWCYLAVALSGLFAAMARLSSPAELVTEPYGLLVLVKCALLAVLGLFGHLHRRRTLPLLNRGESGAFARLAGGEVALMCATVGVAVALSESPPPDIPLPADPVARSVGFPIPPPISLDGVALLWRFDLPMSVVAAVLAGMYGAGLWRSHRAGLRWPVGRSAAWFAGILLLVVVTQGGVARYARVMFSMHLVQNMTLAAPVAFLLVLGAPVTLALRVLRPAAIPGDRGPREWLTVFLGSRAVLLASRLRTAAALCLAAVYVPYATPLYETVMELPLGHLAMGLCYLLFGALCFGGLFGLPPSREPSGQDGSREPSDAVGVRGAHSSSSSRTPYSVIQKSNSTSRSRTARAPHGPPIL